MHGIYLQSPSLNFTAPHGPTGIRTRSLALKSETLTARLSNRAHDMQCDNTDRM